jgi:hypothetical protein
LAINVDLVADASKAIKEAGKLGDALGDVADDLEDVGSAGKSIDDKVQDAFRGMGDEAKAAGKTVGKSVKDGTDAAGEGLGELKDEAAGTAREAAASFGSIEDAAGALQEVAANAFAGFGPAGMAAGIVAAAGIGLAISALTDQADKINENKDKVLALAQTIRDNGGTLRDADYIAAMEDYGYAIQDTKEWFELFQQDAVSGFEQIRDGASKAGVGIGDAFRGQFGTLQDSKKVLEDLERAGADLESQTKDNAVAVDDYGRTLDTTDPAIRKQIDGNKELSDKVRDHIKDLKDAEEIERIRRRAIEGTTEALKEDIDAISERSDAVRGAQSSELDYLDGVDDLTAKLKDNGATLDVNTSKGRDNRRAVLDQAAAIEQVAKDSLAAGGNIKDVTGKFQSQRDALVNQVMPAFGGSRTKAQDYIDTILKTPKTVPTAVQLTGIADAEAKLRALTSAGRHIYVNVATGDTSAVDNYITGMNGKKVYIDVAPRGGVGITN